MTKKERDRIFESVFKGNYKQLYLYATYILGDIEVAKDVVSEVFCKLWDDYSSVDSSKIDSYLFFSVRNKCFDYLRHTKVVNSYIETYITELNLNEKNFKDYDARLDCIIGLIKAMPQRTRFILEQCYLMERSYKEVADELGISTSGVKKHIMKGLETIRAHFMVNYKKGM